jgi:hypothetical protein
MIDCHKEVIYYYIYLYIMTHHIISNEDSYFAQTALQRSFCALGQTYPSNSRPPTRSCDIRISPKNSHFHDINLLGSTFLALQDIALLHNGREKRLDLVFDWRKNWNHETEELSLHNIEFVMASLQMLAPLHFDVLLTDTTDDILRNQIAEVVGIPYLKEATKEEAQKKLDGPLWGSNARPIFLYVVRLL